MPCTFITIKRLVRPEVSLVQCPASQIFWKSHQNSHPKQFTPQLVFKNYSAPEHGGSIRSSQLMTTPGLSTSLNRSQGLVFLGEHGGMEFQNLSKETGKHYCSKDYCCSFISCSRVLALPPQKQSPRSNPLLNQWVLVNYASRDAY